MAMGMTYDQFWDGDVFMAPMFRKAYEIRLDMENLAQWKQGLYIYDAICAVAPILRAFSKAKRPLPYPKEPYDMNTKASEMRQEEREKKQFDKNKAKMETFMLAFNKQFTEKQQKNNQGKEMTDNG